MHSLYKINQYHNLSWKQTLQNRWKISAGISFSTNKDDINTELQDANNKNSFYYSFFYAYKNFSLSNQWYVYLQNRVMLEKKLGGLSALRLEPKSVTAMKNQLITLYDGTKFNETIKRNNGRVLPNQMFISPITSQQNWFTYRTFCVAG